MSTSTSPVDIRADHLEIVQDILRSQLPAGFKAWVFGSRANWTTKDSSDLDLAVEGAASLDHGVMVGLEIAFEESDLPYTVDVVDLNGVSHTFRQIVEGQRVPLPTAGGRAKMGVERPEVTLGDVAEIVMGQSPPGEAVSKDHGLALLNGPTEFGSHHPTPVQFTVDPRKFAEPGDILFCVRGSTTGRMNWADQEYAVGRGVAAIRHREEPALQPFVRGVIEFELPELLAQATGSTFPNVSASQLAGIPYPGLDKDEQRAIAHILGALDDKIELNRRTSQTLEEMARAIFQDWFVDFGPVRAKLDGREPYLPPDLWSIFPDRLVDSELGEIPEGWGVKKLGEVVTTVKGRSYRTSQLAESDTALVTLKSFGRGGGYQPEGLKAFIGDYKLEQVIDPGEIIVACTDVTQAGQVIGHPALVEPSTEYGCLVASLDTIIVRPIYGEISREYLYFLCGTEAFINHTSAYATGTTVLHLSNNAIPSFQIALPTLGILRSFTEIASPLVDGRMKNQLEVDNLAAQRDALLPKLVSGESGIARVKKKDFLSEQER